MNKKRLWASAALVCALMTRQHRRVLPQRTSVPAHFETAWEQLLEQFGIQKPAGGTTSKPDSNGGNTNGGVNGGTNQEGSGSGDSNATTSAAQAILSRVNTARAQNGLSPLALDSAMTRAANVRAAELAKRFSHTRPNGARGLTALAEAGVSYRAAGENIAAGQQTAQAVMAAWMNSSGHRANILSAKYSRLGVGQAVVGGRTYWVQLFAD